MKPGTAAIGVVLGAIATIALHALLIGGTEWIGEQVVGQEGRQRLLRLEWFGLSAVPGYVIAVLATLWLRRRGLAVPALLLVAFSATGILALLLPMVMVVFFEHHTEDLYLCYLAGVFLLASVLLAQRLAARQSG